MKIKREKRKTDPVRSFEGLHQQAMANPANMSISEKLPK
jgi:hypothetical protein